MCTHTHTHIYVPVDVQVVFVTAVIAVDGDEALGKPSVDERARRLHVPCWLPADEEAVVGREVALIETDVEGDA